MPRKAIKFQVQADMPTWVWYLIAGLAALLLVLAIIVILLLCLRRRRKKKKAQAAVPSFYDDQIPHSHSPTKFKSESNLGHHVPAHIPAPPPVAPHPPPLVGGYGESGAFRAPSTQSLVNAAPIHHPVPIHQPVSIVPVAAPAFIAPTPAGNVMMQHVGHQAGRRPSHGMRTVKADVIDNDGYVVNTKAPSPVIIASAPMLPVTVAPLVSSAAQKAHIEQTDTWSNPAYQIPPAADPIPMPPPPAIIPMPPAPTEPIRHNHRRLSTSHSYARSHRSSPPPPPPEPKKRMTAAEKLDMEDGVMDGKHFGKKIMTVRSQHKTHHHRERAAPPPPPPPPPPQYQDDTTEFETTDAEPIRREIINYVPPTRVETEVHLPARVVEVPVYEESPPQYVVVRERMTESQYQQMLMSQGGMDRTMMQTGHAGHGGTVYTNSSASPRMLQGVMPASVLPTFIA